MVKIWTGPALRKVEIIECEGKYIIIIDDRLIFIAEIY